MYILTESPNNDTFSFLWTLCTNCSYVHGDESWMTGVPIILVYFAATVMQVLYVTLAWGWAFWDFQDPHHVQNIVFTPAAR